MSWQPESIPDDDILYRCVHHRCRNPTTGKLTTAALSDKDGTGISTDWQRYSDPETARMHPRGGASNYDVYELGVSEVRYTATQPGALRVEHTPIPINQAHASIFGFYEMESRLKLRIRQELLDLMDERGRVPLPIP